MKLAFIGNGAREHSMIHHLCSYNPSFEIHILPGNAGMKSLGKLVPIEVSDIYAIQDYVLENKIDYVFIGPELPLHLGLVDLLEKNKIPCFGVNKKASQLESSKLFTKKLLDRYEIPTAGYEIVNSYEEAKKLLLSTISYPKVIKADGLASGKGVFIVRDVIEADKVFYNLFIKKSLGSMAAQTVLFENYLEGKEISVFALFDENGYIQLPAIQDYKQLYEGNKGPNTGGMGSYGPVSWISESLKNKIDKELLSPLKKAFEEMQIKYKGILYAGLKVKDNEFYVLEFNVRFGDPEAQVLFPLLDTNFFDIAEAINKNEIHKLKINWKKKSALSIVFSLKGYPENPIKGAFPISYPKDLLKDDDVFLFFSGVVEKNKILHAQGGRILNLVTLGDNLEQTRDKAYNLASKIYFPNLYYRLDIGNE